MRAERDRECIKFSGYRRVLRINDLLNRIVKSCRTVSFKTPSIRPARERCCRQTKRFAEDRMDIYNASLLNDASLLSAASRQRESRPRRSPPPAPIVAAPLPRPPLIRPL